MTEQTLKNSFTNWRRIKDRWLGGELGKELLKQKRAVYKGEESLLVLHHTVELCLWCAPGVTVGPQALYSIHQRYAWSLPVAPWSKNTPYASYRCLMFYRLLIITGRLFSGFLMCRERPLCIATSLACTLLCTAATQFGIIYKVFFFFFLFGSQESIVALVEEHH